MICKLCHRKKTLRKSHIIPEWAYTALYDQDHKYFMISSFDDRIKFKYQGEYEELLCDDCESYLGEFDEYGRNVMLNRPGERDCGLSTFFEDDTIVVEGVQYAEMKLFQLSVLWRAGISSRDFFDKVQLGPHEHAIRGMLVDRDPGRPGDYGCIMLPVLWGTGEPLVDMVLPPESFRANGHRWYKFLFAGCAWMFVVSGHRKNFKHKQLFLNTSHELILPLISAEQAKWIRKNIDLVVRKLNR
jgi:hypothetical protein